MCNCYVVFTLNSGKELTAIPFDDMEAKELDEFIRVKLRENSYVQVGKYGIPSESLRHYEIRERALA